MNGAPQADPDDLEAASSTDRGFTREIDLPDADGQALLESPGLPAPGSMLFAASSGGAGCQSPVDGAGAGNSSQTLAVASPPPIDAPALVGVLFLKTASRLPPPFPSRFFRPPRLS